MQPLFEAARHEPLTTTPWRDDAARQAIHEIAADAVAAYEGPAMWPAHALDDPETPQQRFAGLYFGAAGVVWALQWLARCSAVPAPPGFDDLLPMLPARLRELQPPGAGEAPSYLFGDAGILLLHWQQQRDPQIAQRLFDTVAANAGNPTLEPLWGASGTLLAAIHMAEATHEPRWAALIEVQLLQLLDALQPDPETGLPIWTQDMYGHTVRYLGAGHGLVGNVYAALRAGPLLPAALRERYLEVALASLQALALEGEHGINWHPMSDAARVATRVPLVQDCHGAPGIICRLADGAPRTPEWDRLLRGAGALTWTAGPLAKGASLCHGTAGSALALMKLGTRFGEEMWWQRGRALAWHAAEQVAAARQQHGRGRYALWTGDLGAACVLQAGLSGRADFPTLDVF